MAKKKIEEEFENENVQRYLKEFSSRLTVLRNSKNVSAREMSVSLDKNYGYINSIENGKSFPSLKEFFSICDYLGLEPQEFLSSFSSSDKDKLSDLHARLALLTDSQIDAIHSIVSDLTNGNPVM